MVPITRKLVAITPPQAIVDNASWTTAAIDTLGFAHLRVVVHFGAMDIAMVALKLQESEASDMTGAVDITGAIFGTSLNDTGVASTLPSALADNLFFTFEVDLRGRKRYIDLVATGGDGTAGTFLVAWAELDRADGIVPTTAAQKGVSQNLRVPAL